MACASEAAAAAAASTTGGVQSTSCGTPLNPYFAPSAGYNPDEPPPPPNVFTAVGAMGAGGASRGGVARLLPLLLLHALLARRHGRHLPAA